MHYDRPIKLSEQRDLFTGRDVGISHPDNDAFVRIYDNGMIAAFAKEQLGWIIDPRSNSIIFYADHVKFFTKEGDGGIKWNRLLFNSKATIYTEPLLVKEGVDDLQTLYNGFEQVLEEE